MELVATTHVDDPDGELWHLYRQAFDDLRTRAVQRHVMVAEEFAAVLSDPRITKYVLTDPEGDRVAGFAALTNDLDAVPLISPDYFAHHQPDWFHAKAIWYVIFVCVPPAHQATGAMGRMIGEMCALVAEEGGMICVDICEQRERDIALPDAIGRYGQHFVPGAVQRRMDAQVYWSYETPAGVGRRRTA